MAPTQHATTLPRFCPITVLNPSHLSNFYQLKHHAERNMIPYPYFLHLCEDGVRFYFTRLLPNHLHQFPPCSIPQSASYSPHFSWYASSGRSSPFMRVRARRSYFPQAQDAYHFSETSSTSRRKVHGKYFPSGRAYTVRECLAGIRGY